MNAGKRLRFGLIGLSGLTAAALALSIFVHSFYGPWASFNRKLKEWEETYPIDFPDDFTLYHSYHVTYIDGSFVYGSLAPKVPYEFPYDAKFESDYRPDDYVFSLEEEVEAIRKSYANVNVPSFDSPCRYYANHKKQAYRYHHFTAIYQPATQALYVYFEVRQYDR